MVDRSHYQSPKEEPAQYHTDRCLSQKSSVEIEDVEMTCFFVCFFAAIHDCLTDWEHGPPPKIIVSDFNFFSKLGKIGLKKMLGGVGFPHWTFFSPGASFSQWTFQ